MNNIKNLENEKFIFEQKNKIINESVFITESDISGKITDISDAYLEFTGYKREEVIGKNHKIFRNLDIDKKVIKNLWDTILQDKTWEGELKNHKSTGEGYWIHTIIKPLYDKNHVKTGYISIKNDITAKKRLEEFSSKDQLTLLHNRSHFEYYIKKELNRSTIQQGTVALIIIAIDDFGECIKRYGNDNFYRILLDLSTKLKKQLNRYINLQELFKISESEFAIVILDEEDSYITEYINKLLDLTKGIRLEGIQDKSQEDISISIGAINLNTAINNITGHDLYNMTDINLSKAKKITGNSFFMEIDEEYIKNLKNIDNITKLPNRSALVNDISFLKNESMLIILHINKLNSFKELYGFKFATDILVKKSDELKRVLNENECSLYNLNLQEFAILITDKRMFEKYFLLLKHSILMSDNSDLESFDNYQLADFSAGISYGVENIFHHADLVLQEAVLSKVSHKIYRINQSAKQHEIDSHNRLKVYKEALHDGRIIPHFQPILDSTTDKVVKYEALARIYTNDGEIISPYYFLDAAREDKTFEFFTRQMLQKVFNIYANNNIEISINLTYENINSDSMVEYIKNRLDKFGGERITFEILESEDILDYSIVENFILKVKEFGCKISIDDFGSGYSNFTNIMKFNIDYIKLDGSLIEKLNVDDNVKHMIKGILLYAKNANIKTIAEYVSTKEISDTVKELGIDFMQGYYYGEPKEPEHYKLR